MNVTSLIRPKRCIWHHWSEHPPK